MTPIRIHNRDTGRTETEQVYGEAWLRFAYGNPLGRVSLHLLLKRRVFSNWFGRRMDKPGSAAKIEPFIHNYGLDPTEFADPPDSFRSFNEFFIRKLRPETRPIDPAPGSVVFPADGRHLGFQRADRIESVFVKNQRFDLARLLGDTELAERFAGGSLILSRLCPTDYHRFHFPAAGIPDSARPTPGPLFSVSPLALRRNLSILWENKRMLTRIETEHIGTILMLEIGATCVGAIHQTYEPDRPMAMGGEKGYFAFGGSSVITLFEPDRIRLADDLIESTAAQTELYARMGTTAGSALNAVPAG